MERGEETGLAAIEHLHERGKAWGYQPETGTLERKLTEALQRALAGIMPDADLAAITARAELLLDTADLLGMKPDLWQAQNAFLDAFLKLAGAIAPASPLSAAFAKLATRLNVSPSLLGWRP